ncbi:DUF4297 domain-containing protein [Escherichia coli]|nr:DUF4297 domain-containing protein [Escherichia coli]
MGKEIPFPQDEYGLSKDRAADVRRAFHYQDTVGAQLLIGSLQDNSYVEIWFEHYEDIIAVKENGLIDVYQVKTKSSESKWKSNDKSVIDSINRFCDLEKKYSKSIRRYFFYSNNDVYIPQSSSNSIDDIIRSPLSIKDLIINEKVDAEIEPSLNKWIDRIQQPFAIIKAVLTKMEYIKGKSLTGFQYEVAAELSTLPKINALPQHVVKDISDSLLTIINRANSLDTSAIELYLSITTTNGLSENQNINKRITINEARKVVYKIPNKIFYKKIKSSLVAVSIIVILSFLAFYNLKPESLLERSIRILKSAKDTSIPPEFDEAVSAIRNNKFPLDNIDLSGANFQCKDLSCLTLRRGIFIGIRGTGVNFDSSNLYLAQFGRFSELNASSFKNALMDESNFENANMIGSSLNNTIARSANFKNATLNGANLSNGDFTSSDFSKVNFTQAELNSTNMRYTILTEANLQDVNVSNADLRDTIGLDQKMLDKTCFSPKNPPIVSAPLIINARSCYNNESKHKERQIMQHALKVVGMMSILNGFCDKGKVINRPPDIPSRPDLNIEIPISSNDI